MFSYGTLCNFVYRSKTMIKFIFYTLFAYILFKIFRVFVDPLFGSSNKSQNKATPQPPTQTPNTNTQSTLGEYVEYEEIK